MNPKIIFRSMYVYPETLLYPVSDNARALLEFSKRNWILPTELHLVSNIGFTVVIEGHLRECAGVLRKNEVPFSSIDGKIEYNAKPETSE